jgi:hypothetical protein
MAIDATRPLGEYPRRHTLPAEARARARVASELLPPPALGIIRFEHPELESIRSELRRPTHPLPALVTH